MFFCKVAIFKLVAEVSSKKDVKKKKKIAWAHTTKYSY